MTRKAWKPGLIALTLAMALAVTSSCSSSKGANAPTAPGPSRELDSGNLSLGGVYQHRFTVSGTFAYHCIFHTPMTGTVHVDASAADTVAHVSITSSTMSFPAASVRPGGLVIWTNNSGAVHTVTSN
jgi:plastocyanin